jgi:hypothetical protein
MPANPSSPGGGSDGAVGSNPVAPWATVTGTTYSATAADAYIQTNNAGGTAVTLPLAASVQAGFRLVIINAGSAGTTTATPSEGPPDDTINGSDAGFTTGLTTQWGSVVFVSDGISNWVAVAGA